MTNRTSPNDASSSGGTVRLVDDSLCSAQTALWDGMLGDAALLPILGRLDRTGFASIDLLDGMVFDRCVRRGEDPWRRIRRAVAHCPRTPLTVWIDSRCLFGSRPVGTDVVELAIAALGRAGVRRLGCGNPMNDTGAIAPAVGAARAAGMGVCASLAYARSPAHDDAALAERARALVGMGVDAVRLCDPAGALLPDAARRLIPALLDALGAVPLELALGGRSGQAEVVALDAIDRGIDAVVTAVEPLASGPSMPSSAWMLEHLPRRGTAVGIDAGNLAGVAGYFDALADAEELPRGEHQLCDPDAVLYQIPPPLHGAVAAPLAAETLRVRADLGQPAMVMPLAAIVLEQARRNLAAERRYATLSPEIVACVRGDYGTPPYPVATDLLRRVDGAPPPPTPATAGTLRRDRGPFANDEDLVLAAHTGADMMAALRDARRRPEPEPPCGDTPFDLLVGELERRPALRSLAVRKGGFRYEQANGGPHPAAHASVTGGAA